MQNAQANHVFRVFRVPEQGSGISKSNARPKDELVDKMMEEKEGVNNFEAKFQERILIAGWLN